MIEKIKAILQKDRAFLLYLIFGVLTTAVDWGISFLLYHFWGEAIEQASLLVHAADAVAWICAVLFAFITNRIWVFESKRQGFFPILGELVTFAGGRGVTFLLQEGIMLLGCTVLGITPYAVRVVAAVLVVILNYFISKFLVFRKKK